LGVPTAFIKFEPIKKTSFRFWVKLETLGKLGAFGYGPKASIISR